MLTLSRSHIEARKVLGMAPGLASSREHRARMDAARVALAAAPIAGVWTARDRFLSAQRSGLVPSINNAETMTIDRVASRCTRLRKNLGVAAKWLSKGAGQAWMLTFTYRDSVEWAASHIRDALTHLRKWLLRVHGWKLRYIWVLETQDRKSGARVGEQRPHYHCIVWVPAQVGQFDLRMDAAGWWPHGMTNAVKAVAPVRYVMKYASKFDVADAFPKGARVYGIGGLDDAGVRCRRWINWPSFVQARASVGCRWKRASGGGWVDQHGQCWPSEWALSSVAAGHTRVVRVRTHPRPQVMPDGPFSWLPGRDSFVMVGE